MRFASAYGTSVRSLSRLSLRGAVAAALRSSGVCRRRGCALRAPEQPSIAHGDGHIRTRRDQGSTGPADGRRWQEPRMEEQDPAGLSSAHADSGCVDCRRLSRRDEWRVRRAPATLFNGAIGKDLVSRVWRKGWPTGKHGTIARLLTSRSYLILEGTVVRVRLDRKVTSISLLVVPGNHEDGQKMLLAVTQMVTKRQRPGGRFWTISSGADCASPNS